MLFVAIGALKPDHSSAIRARQRFSTKPTPGVDIVAAYWIQNADAQVVLVVSVECISDLDEIARAWEDCVSFTISPAIDAVCARGNILPNSVGHTESGNQFGSPGIHPTKQGLALRSGFGTAARFLHSLSIHDVRSDLELEPDRHQYEDYPGLAGCLTRREREILSLLSEGRSNRDIAAGLYISRRTVERHIANLYRKIGIHSRAEAIVWTYSQQGLTKTA